MPSVHKIFIGGGGDDWISHIVERYEQRYAKLNPAYQCDFFSWTKGGFISKMLLSLPRKANVTVVGHSYGADTAFPEIQRGWAGRSKAGVPASRS